METVQPDSPATCNLVAVIINHYGGGDHPPATENTLGFFALPFVRGCVDRAVKHGKLSPLGVCAAKSWLKNQRGA